MEKTQRTFWVKPNLWLAFQKQSLDLGKSSSSRIEEFIEQEVKFRKGDKNSKK